ncbi:ABC transporter ATPase [Pasteurellaceae bacterium Macca]|nr:ABC transporter ATPase [Pasteurellaceae bacterium Macca]
MKNMTFRTLLIASVVAVMSINAQASVKTSSLSMVKTQSSNQVLPKQCHQMFKEADKLVTTAEKQPGTHTQLQTMKTKLQASKQQILKMDVVMQEKSCEKGLTALNNMKKL